MTPDQLQKEAERIHSETGCRCEAPKYCACVPLILEALRAVHDAGYQQGKCGGVVR